MRGRWATVGVMLVGASASAGIWPGSAGAAPSGGALPPPLVQVVQVGGRHGVPPDASMAAFNVTAVSPVGAGFLTVYPCDQDVPTTSNVNYLADDVAPSLVFSRLAADGTVCVATFSTTDVLVDLVGYVPAGSSIVPLQQPQRALDTRTQSVLPTPLPAGTSFPYRLAGTTGVPADADTVLFNLTAVGQADPGFVTAWPCDTDRPGTSSVNYQAFEISPNFLVSRTDPGGSVCFFTSASADVVIDVAGYSRGGLSMLARPERIHDSRLAGGPAAAGTTLPLGITARADVPDDATAAVYNLTAVDAAEPGFLTSHPCGTELPDTSNLNYARGAAVANATITQLSTDGHLCIYNLTRTNLIVDLIGYVRGGADYRPLAPLRILDTRVGWQPPCQWIIAHTWLTFTAAETRVTNVITGESFVGPFIQVDLQRANEPFVDRDCTGYWYAGGPYPGQLLFVPFPGSAPKTGLPVGGTLPVGGYRGYGQLTDGTIVAVDSDGDVVRVSDGVVLADLPYRFFVSQADISENGVVTLRLGALATNTVAGRAYIEVWDMRSATLISDITVDRLTSSMDLSPDGTYITLDTNTFVRNVTTVITLDGDVVDTVSRSGDTILRSFFWGDGSLFLCADREGAYTWNLFSAPQLFARPTDARFFGLLRSTDPLTEKPCNLMWT